MEISLRGGALAEIDYSAVLSSARRITLEGIAHSSSLWNLSGESCGDGVEVVDA